MTPLAGSKGRRVHRKSPAEIRDIARAGAIISSLFAEIKPLVRPGAATAELDRFVDDFVRSHRGAVSAFRGLYGFPASACISVNEEVVHGIPSERMLREGEIVTIDVGVRRRSWCADSAYTFPVGEVGREAALLMKTTYGALGAAVAAATPGGHVGDIGAAVVEWVRPTGHAIFRDLVGHGIGRSIHEEPQVPNLGERGEGVRLEVGMVLAIEPMLGTGTDEIRTLSDDWTVVTADHSLSAHFEHTVAVTAEGPLVLTGGAIWGDAKGRDGEPWRTRDRASG
ncbi:MAG: type I methionyl aminopeptidase [Gemmatimonadetes bacterium]|nr:type I methionyl aminopeptidase [Gemmatimonadota bacterium]